MSTLPEITERICQSIAVHDYENARRLALQAAVKMGTPRMEKIQNWFKSGMLVQMPINSKYWYITEEKRSPWVSNAVNSKIGDWLNELEHAEALIDAGEKILPLLLVGETRCGKTSTLCALANNRGFQVRRMSIAEIFTGYMGETAKAIKKSFDEIRIAAQHTTKILWLIDEIDGVAQKRSAGTSASQEQANAIATLLTELESLPPKVSLVATSNMIDTVDLAVLGRFNIIEFPKWNELTMDEKKDFAKSHQSDSAFNLNSYAEVVKQARTERIKKIIQTNNKG